MAKFVVKPSKGSSEVDLDKFTFTIKKGALWSEASETSFTNYKVKVDWTEVAIDSYTNNVFVVSSDLNETISGEGIVVETIAKNPTSANYVTTLVNVNDSATALNRQYTRLVMPVKVSFVQENQRWSTKISASMDNWDNDVDITSIELFVWDNSKWVISNISEGNDGDVEIAWEDGTKMIDKIVITTNEASNNVYTINKSAYNDFFKVGSTYLKIFDKDSTASN